MEISYDFEKPILALEKKLQDLRDLSTTDGLNLKEEIQTLEARLQDLIEEVTSKLTPWQRVQLSRHPSRPYSKDYIDALFPDFLELHGDRAFGDDPAILGGIATWEGKPILILAHQKGRSTKQKMERNFGMAKPEGYRKAMRLMQLAHRFKMPVLTLIDTPGAYPGLEAEERGQAQAIAESILMMFGLQVPILCFVIGEGGSGGALALGCGDRVLMLEHSTYSVISPESCASILWNDAKLAERAAERLKVTSSDLFRLGLVDGVIPEPKGGAHRDWEGTFARVRETLKKELPPLLKLAEKDPEELVKRRAKRYRGMGQAALGRTKEK